jgi:AhpD family alkylhydroperoxidase
MAGPNMNSNHKVPPAKDLARIPLVPETEVPAIAKRLVSLLGQVPISMRAYAHRPQILKGLVDLEMAVLPEGSVDVLTKARVGYVVSRLNNCAYCAAHVGGRLRNNGVSEEELACTIGELGETGDPAIDAAVAYAKLAATGNVTDEDVTEISRYYTPEQIVEITCVVGFFCFVNRVHTALGLEIEDRFERIGAHRIVPAAGEITP